MTARERVLLHLLAAVVVASVGAVAVSMYFDERNRLDLRSERLVKEVTQAEARSLPTRARPDEPTPFWKAGTMPGPLDLAQTIRPALYRQGIVVKEFQVAEATPTALRLRYVLETPMAPFLDASLALSQADLRLITHRLSVNARERGGYTIVWEVGYAVSP